MKKLTQFLNPDELPKNPAFSNVAIVTGPHRTIYIGGQDAVNAQGEVIGKNDLGKQAIQILANFERPGKVERVCTGRAKPGTCISSIPASHGRYDGPTPYLHDLCSRASPPRFFNGNRCCSSASSLMILNTYYHDFKKNTGECLIPRSAPV